jgi:hypothetical protein
MSLENNIGDTLQTNPDYLQTLYPAPPVMPDFALIGVTGTLIQITQGGTGANTTAGALSNLGAAKSGANTDITSLTPNSITIGSGTAVTKVRAFSASLTPSSVAAAISAEEAFTVSGLTTADKVIVNGPAPTAGTGIVNARVSAANTLALTFGNFTAGALTPTSGTYLIIALRT